MLEKRPCYSGTATRGHLKTTSWSMLSVKRFCIGFLRDITLWAKFRGKLCSSAISRKNLGRIYPFGPDEGKLYSVVWGTIEMHVGEDVACFICRQ